MAFSLKQFLFLVAAVAAGLIAITNADLPIVAELVDLLTIGLIVIAGYGVWVNAGEERAFRIGFVAWAGVYFLATRWWNIAFVSATGKLLQIIKWSYQPSRLTDHPGSSVMSGPSREAFIQAEGDWMNRFDSIGHCLFALLFGLVGGCVTVYFYRKRLQMLSKTSQQTKSE